MSAMKSGRLFRSWSLSFALALAACGGDDDGGGGSDGSTADAAANFDAAPRPDAEATIDAMPADLSCLGDPLPTEAANPVSVSGMVFTIAGGAEQPVEDALVEARRISNDNVLDDNGTGGTPTDGTFTLSANTAGNPLEAYLYVTKEESLPTRVYPPMPIAGDLVDVPVPLLDGELLALLTLLAGNIDQDPGNGVIFLVTVDCAGNPAQGATVTADPAAGEVIYAADNGFPDVEATATGAQGLTFLFNVPPGAVTVNAVAAGQELLAHQVESVAGEITATVVVPGPFN
jgi:hypothetical protein